jgi:hypothetical protein
MTRKRDQYQLPSKPDRYAVMNAAFAGDWEMITPDALRELSVKALKQLLGTIPRQHARSQTRDEAIEMIKDELKHAQNQLEGR